MTDTLSQRIQALLDSEAAATLAHIRRGIEKESLRITDQGLLAHTPHPRELGSALTHPYYRNCVGLFTPTVILSK